MTDEEARHIVMRALNVDEDYGDMAIEMRLVQAGYRAAMVEVWERRSAVVAACPELEDALFRFNLWVHEQVQKAGE